MTNSQNKKFKERCAGTPALNTYNHVIILGTEYFVYMYNCIYTPSTCRMNAKRYNVMSIVHQVT